MATQDDLDKIDEQLAKTAVVKNSTFSDQSTTFRDADDALKVRGFVARQVAGTGRSRTRYAATSKGC